MKTLPIWKIEKSIIPNGRFKGRKSFNIIINFCEKKCDYNYTVIKNRVIYKSCRNKFLLFNNNKTTMTIDEIIVKLNDMGFSKGDIVYIGGGNPIYFEEAIKELIFKLQLGIVILKINSYSFKPKYIEWFKKQKVYFNIYYNKYNDRVLFSKYFDNIDLILLIDNFDELPTIIINKKYNVYIEFDNINKTKEDILYEFVNTNINGNFIISFNDLDYF